MKLAAPAAMLRLSVLLVFSAVCKVNYAQNGYNYDRPDLGLGLGSTSRPGFGGTSPAGYPSPSGFGGVAGPTTPAYQQGSTGYPVGRPSGPAFGQPGATGPAGGVGYPGVAQPDFTGAGSFPGSAGGSGFGGVGTAPGFSGDNTGFPAIGSRPSGAGPIQQRPSVSPAQSGQTGLVGDTGIRTGSSSDGQYEGGDYSAIPGEPGIDYPIFSEIPETSFDCNQQQYPGYYADVEAQCQVFHICALNRTFNFLCPNGTIFSQEHFVCVWWNQFDCASAPGLFEKNANLYDYSKTGRPSTDTFSGSQPGSGAGVSGVTGPTAGGAPYPGRPQSSRPSGVPVGPSASAQGYPTGPAGVYPGTRPPVGFQQSGQIPSNVPTGYPAASAPSGPSFPSGPSQPGYPGSGQPDGQFSPSPQAPTRDYLPPRQG